MIKFSSKIVKFAMVLLGILLSVQISMFSYMARYTLWGLFKEVIPITQTYFLSYKSFVKRTTQHSFPKELPESAHDIQYYFYEGFFADKSGYHAAFSREEYELMKENRLAAFEIYLPDDGYCYDGSTKLYFDREQLKQQRINYIDNILPEESGDDEYYILAYGLFENSEIYSYDGVLCKDETCEIVEFSCRCPK